MQKNLFRALFLLMLMISIAGVSTADGTMGDGNESVERVQAVLKDGTVILDYFKPTVKTVPVVTWTPEMSDMDSFEAEYIKNKLKITEDTELKKRKYNDSWIISFDNQTVSLNEITGKVEYRRKESDEPLEPITKDTIILRAENFINTYGGGLPEDAMLREISSYKHQNISTDEVKIQNYTVYYERFINGYRVELSDMISVSIDHEGINQYSRLWKNYTNTGDTYTLMDEREVFEQNINNLPIKLSDSSEQEYKVIEVNVIYLPDNLIQDTDPAQRLIPFWAYRLDDGFEIYINATTGEMLE